MEKDKTKICGYKTFYKAGTCGITSSFMTLVVTGQSFSLAKSSKVVVCRSRYVSEFTFRGRFSDIPSLIKLAAVHQIMFAYRRIYSEEDETDRDSEGYGSYSTRELVTIYEREILIVRRDIHRRGYSVGGEEYRR